MLFQNELKMFKKMIKKKKNWKKKPTISQFWKLKNEVTD